MSSIDQYTALFDDSRSVIDANSSPVMNALRDEAAASLRSAGRFPDRGDESFEKTSIEEMFAPDYGVNVNRVNIPVDIAASFRCEVPNLSTLLAVVVNDRFVPSATLLKNLPKGVEVCSLAEAAANDPSFVAAHYGKLARLQSPGTALNTMLAQDGVMIRVRRGVRLEKPVQLVDIFNSPVAMLSCRRILLVAEEGARIAVLRCDHTQNPSTCFLASEVVEVFCGNGAEVEWYDIEEASLNTSRYSQLYARQKSGSSLTVCGATLTNGSTRNEYSIDVVGEHCHTRLSGMAIGSDTQHIDNYSTLRHAGDHGRSEQLFKYVLDEKSTGAFEGSIEVCHGSRFVEAFQTNRNILASQDARMHTKPQLLIYNDDVKCSHGATTGQLDTRALFYMRQRGIPLATARMMLMQAFMVDVIDSIRLDTLRDRLRHMVEKRFSGNRVACSDCGAPCVNEE